MTDDKSARQIEQIVNFSKVLHPHGCVLTLVVQNGQVFVTQTQGLTSMQGMTEDENEDHETE